MAGQTAKVVTVLQFRTFGDYVLRSAFYQQLWELHSPEKIIVLTNRRGADILPLVDSRLTVVVVDKRAGFRLIWKTLRSLPKADILYSMESSIDTLLLLLLVRAAQKIGWSDYESFLYSKGEFRPYVAQPRWLPVALRLILTRSYVRRAEDRHDAAVELKLLGSDIKDLVLSEYRSPFAIKASGVVHPETIYCSAETGWLARQLTPQQWKDLISELLAAFPQHQLLLHASEEILAALPPSSRLTPFHASTFEQLFGTISQASLVISGDSLALHLASLYDVPSVGLFGPAHPHRFRGTSRASESIFHKPPCSPCLQARGTSCCEAGLQQCSSLSLMTAAEVTYSALKVVDWATRTA